MARLSWGSRVYVVRTQRVRIEDNLEYEVSTYGRHDRLAG